jgi:hypothetical protein
MNETKSGLVTFGFAMIPYMAMAWGYSYFTDGGQPAFWRALGFLIVVRLFFSIIETLGRILAWRLFYRKQAVEHFVQMFRKRELPAKEYYDDDFGNYCARLINSGLQKVDHARNAQEIQTFLWMHEKRGILEGMRMHAAVEAAFEQYMKTLPKSAKSRFAPH